jgi:hypothetical protein
VEVLELIVDMLGISTDAAGHHPKGVHIEGQTVGVLGYSDHAIEGVPVGSEQGIQAAEMGLVVSDEL